MSSLASMVNNVRDVLTLGAGSEDGLAQMDTLAIVVVRYTKWKQHKGLPDRQPDQQESAGGMIELACDDPMHH